MYKKGKSSSLRHQRNSQNTSGDSHNTKACSSSSTLLNTTQQGAGAESLSPSSFSSRLSLKSLGRRRSPVRTQFNLPDSSTSPLTKGAAGTDQIPTDSISALPSSTNTSSVAVAGGSGYSGGGGDTHGAPSSSCVSNNNNSASNHNISGTGYISTGQPCSRSSLLKKERGASSSPPLQRAHFQDEAGPSSTSGAGGAASSSLLSTNPILTLSSTVITEPADPSIPWVPGTSAPISVDRVHSVKITRKLLHNWRSACGRTRDKTKDLIRRWKTLPENHPDFEQCPPASPNTSKKKVSSTSNLNSTSPGLKKKLDKSAGKGASENISVSVPSLSTTPSVTVNATKNDPKVATSSSVTLHATTAATIVTSAPELRSCISSGSKTNVYSGTTTNTSATTAKQHHQLRTTIENEMPVVGIIGKSSSSSGGGDGTGGSGVNTIPGGASNSGGGFGSRLGSGMMPGIGRPSVSINNSVTINGRTASGDMSGGTGGPSGGQGKSSTGWTVHVWGKLNKRYKQFLCK